MILIAGLVITSVPKEQDEVILKTCIAPSTMNAFELGNF